MTEVPRSRRYTYRSTLLYHVLSLILIASLGFGTVGCKAKKEAKAAAEARAEKIAKARADLLSVINDQGSMSTDEKEEIVEQVRDMNLQDAEIQNLIDQAEAIISDERAAARTGDKKPEASSGSSSNEDVSSAFSDIANAAGGDASLKIEEALNMFASPSTPVLIIISESGDQVDYDEPTTIRKYLEYLGDTGSAPANVKNLEYDGNGKIKEVELIKNYN